MSGLKKTLYAISLPFRWLGFLIGILFMIPVFAGIACMNGVLTVVLWAGGKIDEMFDDPFEQNN